MATFNHISGAEPSTITFKAATVTQTRNSSVMHQELISLADAESSVGIARVLAAAPASTEYGLAVRIVSGPSSAADLLTAGNSTVIQGTSPWIIGGDSTIVFKPGYISSVAQSGNSSGLTVRPVWSSSGVDQPVRAILSSTRGDNVVNIDGQSTVIQGTSPWIIGGDSTIVFKPGYISSVAQSGNSSGLTVRPVWSSSGVDQPVRALLSSTRADNVVNIDGQSTCIQGTNPWVVGFPAAYISSVAQSGNSSGLTVRPVWSSTGTDQPVSAAQAGTWNIATVTTVTSISSLSTGHVTVDTGSIQVSAFAAALISSAVLAGGSSALNVRNVWSSTNADQPVYARSFCSTAADFLATVTIGGNLQSTVAPSSGSSGLVVRPVIDAILTAASTSAFTSTSFTIQSSGAALRSYVTAYSITTTNAGPTQVAFYSSGTMTWPVVLAATSSAVSGVNLAVSAPAYIFRTAASEALTLQTNQSTVAGWVVAVAYYRAP